MTVLTQLKKHEVNQLQNIERIIKMDTASRIRIQPNWRIMKYLVKPSLQLQQTRYANAASAVCPVTDGEVSRTALVCADDGRQSDDDDSACEVEKQSGNELRIPFSPHLVPDDDDQRMMYWLLSY